MVTFDSYSMHEQEIFGVSNNFYEFKEVLRPKNLRTAAIGFKGRS